MTLRRVAITEPERISLRQRAASATRFPSVTLRGSLARPRALPRTDRSKANTRRRVTDFQQPDEKSRAVRHPSRRIRPELLGGSTIIAIGARPVRLRSGRASAPRARDPRPLQHVGGNARVTPRTIRNPPPFREPFGN